METSALLKHIEAVTVAAGEKLLSQTVTVNSHKTKNDLLTENDLVIENFIIAKLTEVYPRLHIVSEEYNPDNTLDEGYTVVIDPIDGTCNFAVGMSLYGVQLALFCEGVCVGAVIYFPETKELLTAEKGKGAYLNGKPLTVNKSAKPSDGMLFISDYYDSIDIPLDFQFDLVKGLQSTFLKTRHFGAACVDFSMIAKGHGLAYITHYHKLWDIAPGLLIATEAGCVFGAVDRPTYEYGRPGLALANSPETLERILSLAASLREKKAY